MSTTEATMRRSHKLESDGVSGHINVRSTSEYGTIAPDHVVQITHTHPRAHTHTHHMRVCSSLFVY